MANNKTVNVNVNVDTKDVKTLKKELTDIEKQTGKNSAEFKSYVKEIEVGGVSINRLSDGFGKLKTGLGAASLGFRGLAGAIAATGVGALVIALGALIAYFTQTKKGVEQLEEAMVVLQGVIEPIIASFAKLGEGLVNIFSGNFREGINGVTSSFDGLGESIAENVKVNKELLETTRELEDAQRELTITNSELDKQITDLIVKSKNKNITEKERIKLLEDADKLEKQKIKNETDFANLSIANAEKEIAAQQKLGKDTDELESKRAELISKRNGIEQKSLALQEKIDQRKEDLSNKEKERLEKETQKKEEEKQKQLKIEQEYQKTLSDLQNEFGLSEFQKLEKSFDDKIALIKGQNVEEILLITELEDAKAKAIDDFNKKREEKLKQEKQLKFEKEQQDKQFEIETELLTLEENDILRNEKLNELDELNKETLKQKRDNGLISEKEYNFELEKINQDRRKREKSQEEKALEEQRTIQEAKLFLVDSIGKGLIALSDLIGTEGEKGAKFAKAVALFQIGVDAAKSLASSIAGASAAAAATGPAAPFVLGGYIATSVATVLAAIGQARKLLSKESQPKKPKSSKPQGFATGGYISGDGSGTSDSIPAMLSNGESVINANSTRMFKPILSALNEYGGGVRFASGGLAGSTSSQSSINAIIDSDDIARKIGLQLQRTPIRSYVIEQEVTNAQQVNALINRRAIV